MRRILLAAAWLAIGVAMCAAALTAQPQHRHFTLSYEFTINDVEQGKPLRVWIPLAVSDEYQAVAVTARTGDLPLKETRERQYGNRMLYGETASATQGSYRFRIDYDVVRREHMVLNEAERQLSEDVHSQTPMLDYVSMKPRRDLERFRQADRLVPISGRAAEMAAQQVVGRSGELQRARAFYDYVLGTLKYDKSGTGWGRGDVEWVCDNKRGNCSDFHSLFISMARSVQIPAKFEMGIGIPTSKHAGEIPGYHCWAEFWLYGKGWVPVDISEAWKDAARRGYFFGAHDVNRVQFSVGRDITLSPAQAAGPVNFFIYPYVEVGGAAHPNVATHWEFKDVQ
jgi:transglutaminase-like putative cysteine protease